MPDSNWCQAVPSNRAVDYFFPVRLDGIALFVSFTGFDLFAGFVLDFEFFFVDNADVVFFASFGELLGFFAFIAA